MLGIDYLLILCSTPAVMGSTDFVIDRWCSSVSLSNSRDVLASLRHVSVCVYSWSSCRISICYQFEVSGFGLNALPEPFLT